jgi:hypothetical protein
VRHASPLAVLLAIAGSLLLAAPAAAESLVWPSVRGLPVVAPDCTPGHVNAPPGFNVIMGTPGDDTIDGTAGNDFICGLAGNDTINALGGDDIIVPGAGNDGTPALPVDGGPGQDLIDGGPGAATPGIDSDTITGNIGGDTISYAGRTTPVGVRFHSGLPGYGGTNCQVSGDASPGGTPLANCSGDDGRPAGENDSYTDVENIVGGAASDALIGGRQGNILNGGPGENPDIICGGEGDDLVDYSNRTAPLTV